MLIKQNKKVHIDIGPEIVKMYECSGQVHSVFDFANNNKEILKKTEASIIEKNLIMLQKKESIPDYLNKCLARTDDLKINDNIFELKRSGARSAYWEDRRIKFKGCRPMVKNPATFPIEKLGFGSDVIEYDSIPFGILTKEAVLREILGFCFFKEKELEIVHKPICIYEYCKDNEQVGYCIVFETMGETRLEQFVNYPQLTLKELIEIKFQRLKTTYLLGSELLLNGVNVKRCSEAKAKILTEMHFSGGFRGILNSNIGNDIILKEASFEFAICDFDCFRVISIPKQPDIAFLNGFVMYCLIEVLKGSISILEFYQFNENLSLTEYNKVLFEKYTQTSSIWKAYERMFWIKAKEQGWDISLVNDAFENILKTKSFFQIQSLVIPNNKAIDDIVNLRNIYYSHD